MCNEHARVAAPKKASTSTCKTTRVLLLGMHRELRCFGFTCLYCTVTCPCGDPGKTASEFAPGTLSVRVSRVKPTSPAGLPSCSRALQVVVAVVQSRARVARVGRDTARPPMPRHFSRCGANLRALLRVSTSIKATAHQHQQLRFHQPARDILPYKPPPVLHHRSCAGTESVGRACRPPCACRSWCTPQGPSPRAVCAARTRPPARAASRCRAKPPAVHSSGFQSMVGSMTSQTQSAQNLQKPRVCTASTRTSTRTDSRRLARSHRQAR